ncbi:hypothetical protein PVAND_004750 [Polypedilum vanderplanki]|uniref:Peptidase C1A papain C-terminal domain-containing protein n=1 Tax=Polypedilum vanderplanki TaxID=319348 RepID=A0A9J6BYI5_POLVA|nr:hypothetical protein PVAND_004750 [Polypedilum vanderplanki]
MVKILICKICRQKCGLNYEVKYPYKETETTCNCNPANDYVMFRQQAWIATCLDATDIQYYKTGVITPTNCGSTLNHAVNLVFYGTQNGVDYWIARNYWGSD